MSADDLRLDMDELLDELAEMRLRIRDQARVEKCLDNAVEILTRMHSHVMIPDIHTAPCPVGHRSEAICGGCSIEESNRVHAERDAERQRADAAEREAQEHFDNYQEMGEKYVAAAKRADAAERERDEARALLLRRVEASRLDEANRRITELVTLIDGDIRKYLEGNRRIRGTDLLAIVDAAIAAPASPATAGHIPGQVCEGGCSMKCVKKPGVSLDTHKLCGICSKSYDECDCARTGRR